MYKHGYEDAHCLDPAAVHGLPSCVVAASHTPASRLTLSHHVITTLSHTSLSLTIALFPGWRPLTGWLQYDQETERDLNTYHSKPPPRRGWVCWGERLSSHPTPRTRGLLPPAGIQHPEVVLTGHLLTWLTQQVQGLLQVGVGVQTTLTR